MSFETRPGHAEAPSVQNSRNGPSRPEKAVQAFREQAQQTEEKIQTVLPLSEVVGLLEQGLGQLLRAVGQELMQSVMEAEVRQRVGEPHQPNRQREYYRWGQEQATA